MWQYLPRYSLLAYSLLTTATTLAWSPSFFLRNSIEAGPLCRIRRFATLLSPPAAGTALGTTKTARMMATTATTGTNTDGQCPLETHGLPSPIILGSASFTRKLILKEMNIPYHIVIRPIDEKNLGDRSKDPPAELVLALGKAKADHLVKEIQAGRCQDDLANGNNKNFSDKNAGMIVLTGDQVVTCAGKILEKPESVQEAKQFVSQYPANPPSTVGSCVLTHVPSGIQVFGVDTATVHFRNDFSGDELVDALLEEEAPILSCAGGLMVEHPKVRQNIKRIDGTEDSVMGLSKALVLRLLHEMAGKLKDANFL